MEGSQAARPSLCINVHRLCIYPHWTTNSTSWMSSPCHIMLVCMIGLVRWSKLTIPAASVQHIPHNSSLRNFSIMSVLNSCIIPEWNQTILCWSSGQSWPRRYSAIFCESCLELQNIMNFRGCIPCGKWRMRLISWKLFAKWSILMTATWIFPRLFESRITEVFLCHIFRDAEMSFRMCAGRVAETTWKGTCDGSSQRSFPSWPYSGWKSFPHWLIQCPSSIVILNKCAVKSLALHRSSKHQSLTISSGLRIITRYWQLLIPAL